MEELVYDMRDRETNSYGSYGQLQSKLQDAEIFGKISQQIAIATNLIGLLSDEVIAETTGLSLENIKYLSGKI
ncbi:hypothetical protein I6U48_26580 [Clostridium sp. PL3]|uniref:Uncharacterized protein n=1 Tax=Clostridium thailandense TaxID=2794346 RepID=A0A949U300_9CLOT|nr:hypothetical protein [Clostridium thailandense]MBV7276451.1 hypothetical protein [Clostridium thailandense]